MIKIIGLLYVNRPHKPTILVIQRTETAEVVEEIQNLFTCFLG